MAQENKVVVKKFGGKCVKSLELIIEVAKFLKEYLKKKQTKIVVVISAMGDFTNKIEKDFQILAPIKFLKEKELLQREIDGAMSTGEIIAANNLTAALKEIGVNAIALDAFQLDIATTGGFENAMISDISMDKLNNYLFAYDILVVAGFQGIHEEESDTVVTLGRGGSDMTAVALASKLHCTCIFYKDAAGITTFDPEIINDLKPKILQHISYANSLTMAQYGYPFLQARCLQVAQDKGVPIEFNASPGLGGNPWLTGTIIGPKTNKIEESPQDFSAICLKKGYWLMNINNIPNIPGWAEKIFTPFEDMPFSDFHQVSHGKENELAVISIIIGEKIKTKFKEIFEKAVDQINNFDNIFTTELKIVCLTLIDSRMIIDGGFARRVAKALSEYNINIINQQSSGNKIHYYLAEKNAAKAVIALAAEFNLF